MLSKTIMIGRIPTYENAMKASNIDDEQKATISFTLGVQKDFKAKDAQYFEEDLFNYRAFGKAAQFINKNIKPGDNVYIVSRAVGAKKKPDSNEYYPMYFQVETISWTPGNSKRTESAGAKATTTEATSVANNPFVNQAQSKGSEDSPFSFM